MALLIATGCATRPREVRNIQPMPIIVMSFDDVNKSYQGLGGKDLVYSYSTDLFICVAWRGDHPDYYTLGYEVWQKSKGLK
jgi:hypothetical protein